MLSERVGGVLALLEELVGERVGVCGGNFIICDGCMEGGIF